MWITILIKQSWRYYISYFQIQNTMVLTWKEKNVHRWAKQKIEPRYKTIYTQLIFNYDDSLFPYVDVTKYDKQGNLQKKEFIFLTAQRNESSSKWGAWQQASGMMAEAGITYERSQLNHKNKTERSVWKRGEYFNSQSLPPVTFIFQQGCTSPQLLQIAPLQVVRHFKMLQVYNKKTLRSFSKNL